MKWLLLLAAAGGGATLFLRRRRPQPQPSLLVGDEFDRIVARIVADEHVDPDPTPPHGIPRPVDRAMPLPGLSFRDRQLAARIEEEERRRYRR